MRKRERSAAGAGPGPVREARCQAPAVLAWTIWLGLLGGLLELAAVVLKYRVLHPRNFNVSRHYPWMYPLAGVLVLLGPGLVLALASAVRGPRRGPTGPQVVGSLAFFVYLGLLFRAPITTAACLVLAAGLAVQTARLVKVRGAGTERLVRWTLGPLLGLLAAAALLCFGGPVWASRRTADPKGPAATSSSASPSPSPRNVLLIVLDTVRAGSLGLYGSPGTPTPGLERLARGGVRFDRALSTAPWTAPSHAGMFTGRWPHQLSVGWSRPLDRTDPTLAEFLAGLGYGTAGFVANTTYCSYETGLDRGFAHYEDYDVSLPAILLCSAVVERSLNFVRNHAALGLGDVSRTSVHRKTADRINADFLAWLSAQRRDEAGRDRPFFAFLNYYDAHHPYLDPDDAGEGAARHGLQPRSAADYRLLRNWWTCDKRNLTPAERDLVRDSYERCVGYLDSRLGRLFDELERRGVLDETIVIVTSDHGEHLGEHRLYGHGCSLYRPELHVPLVIRAPGLVPEGETVARPVSLRDLPATVVDLLDLSGRSPFPGRSLARCWASPAGARASDDDPASWVVSELAEPPETDPNGGRSPVCRGPLRSIVAGRWHYIERSDGQEELYDFENDPDEAHDLARSPSAEAAGVLHRLRDGALNHLAKDLHGAPGREAQYAR